MSATSQEAFRAEVRAWLEASAPTKGSADDFSSVHVVSASTIDGYRRREHDAFTRTCAWQRTLFDAGYAGRSWAVEYGGRGESAWQDDVIAEEQSRFGVSTKMLAIALEMLPPVLFAHGTHEQRVRYLPAVVRGEQSWCQLLSEPNAGSDLGSASLTYRHVFSLSVTRILRKRALPAGPCARDRNCGGRRDRGGGGRYASH